MTVRRSALHVALDAVLDYAMLRNIALDVAEFKETEHPREKGGKFTAGAGAGKKAASVASKMPLGMENVDKGPHKTATAFVKAQLKSGEFNDKGIAQAASHLYGKPVPLSYIAHVKKYEANKAAKQAGIKANNAAITQAAKNPVSPAKLTEYTTAASKTTSKPMYASCVDSKTGATVYCKVAEVPDGLQDTDSIKAALAKQGLTVKLVGQFDPNKAVPPGGYKDVAIPAAEVQALKDAKYAKAKTNERVTESAEELSKAVVASIKGYTDGSYKGINGALRRGSPMTAVQATLAAHLDAAIKSSKLKADITVYRGVGDPEKFFGPNPTVGTVIVDNGYVSTSKDVSTSFSGTKCSVKLKKGAHALDVQDMSLHSHEKEVVLPRGSLFKITGITNGVIELAYFG
jgi:ADP-ribosyltransferase exoenzyme